MATFKADRGGIGEMLRASFMQAEMRRRAEKVRARAIALSPTGDPAEDPHPGLYRASFTVSSGVQHRKTARAYGEVANHAPHALIVEFGTSRQRGHRVLMRALDAAKE